MGSRATPFFVAFAASVACSEAGDASKGSGRALPPPLGACVDTNDATDPTGSSDSRRQSTSVEGRVEEVALGMADPEDTLGCPLVGTLSFGDPGLGPADELAQTSWLRVHDAANREIVVSALAEGFAFPLAPGDVVRARIDVEPIGFGVEANAFEARTADGALLFWVGFGPDLAELEPPSEVQLSKGAVDVELEDDCVGSYQVQSLNVTVEGTTVSVPSGARVEVGRWMVVNGVTQEQTGMTVCPDAFASQIEVAVWALEGQVRETGGMGGPCYANLPIEQSEGAPQFRCLPDGTLTRECGASGRCPGVSECAQGFCRSPVD